MKLLINTSEPISRLIFIDGDWQREYEYKFDRTLAKNLLKFIFDKLTENNKLWSDISEIGVFSGPGSFTGLRIGLTVVNTLSDGLSIPIVSGTGENWQQEVLQKLESGQNEKIVLPMYGSEPRITVPKK